MVITYLPEQMYTVLCQWSSSCMFQSCWSLLEAQYANCCMLPLWELAQLISLGRLQIIQEVPAYSKCAYPMHVTSYSISAVFGIMTNIWLLSPLIPICAVPNYIMQWQIQVESLRDSRIPPPRPPPSAMKCRWHALLSTWLYLFLTTLTAIFVCKYFG